MELFNKPQNNSTTVSTLMGVINSLLIYNIRGEIIFTSNNRSTSYIVNVPSKQYYIVIVQIKNPYKTVKVMVD